MSDVELRLLRSDEHGAAAALFQRAFGHARTTEEWRWRYDDNPHGPPLLMGAFDDAGELAGFIGGYPVTLVDSSSPESREVTVVHAGDAMVDPDREVRLSAGGSPWLKAIGALCEVAAERGHRAVYGVMAKRLARVYNRYVGTRDLTDIQSWTAPVDSLLLPDGAGYSVTRLRRPADVSLEMDSLLRRAAPEYGLLVRRDAEYVRWRHLQRPDGRTRLWAARVGAELVGWAAFRRDGRRLLWGDLLLSPGHADAAGAILAAEVRSFPWFRPPTEVEGWFPSAPDWSSGAIRKLGLEPGPEREGLTSNIWGCTDRREAARRLYYTRADCDLF